MINDTLPASTSRESARDCERESGLSTIAAERARWRFTLSGASEAEARVRDGSRVAEKAERFRLREPARQIFRPVRLALRRSNECTHMRPVRPTIFDRRQVPADSVNPPDAEMGGPASCNSEARSGRISRHRIMLGFDPIDISENTAARDRPSVREKWNNATAEFLMHVQCSRVVPERVGE
jgi:hypothetical protein